MEETEIVKDGEKSKGVICQVNVSEVFDIIVPCNVVLDHLPTMNLIDMGKDEDKQMEGVKTGSRTHYG
ncbi:6839_t:CDS:2 [Entrophospora sp. SA101]|nr:8577_t:CDS:2 [Entrophospora sp. SA101]CAJ0763785.1 6839_t:CDS:2 [Entrophospora sp. SA101]